MKFRFLIFAVLLVLFNTIQAGLQYVDKDFVSKSTGVSQVFYSAISENRLWISLLLGFFAFSLPIYREYVGPRQLKAEMKKTVMETIMNDVFNGIGKMFA